MIFKAFTEWVSNKQPPWVEFWALMVGRLVGLENHPDLIFIRFGDTWRCHMVKYILELEGTDTNEVCGTNKLCVVM